MSGEKFLVAVASDDRARGIVRLLAGEFGAATVAEAKSLSDAESRRGTVEWLIVSERWFDDNSIAVGVPEGLESPGSALARRWTEERDGKAAGRAVVLTETQWWNSDVAFSDRLLGLPKIGWDWYLPQLIEMIHAAEAGVILLPPTTITYGVEVEDSTIWLRYLRVGEGPLAPLLRRRLEGSGGARECTHRECSSRPFLAVLQSREGDRRGAVLRLTRAVYNTLAGTGFLDEVREIAREAIDKLKIRAPKDRIGPYPVHLHLECDPAAFSLPIDLALREDADGRDVLCMKLPVVWLLRRSEDEPSAGPTPHNETGYSSEGFTAAHSGTIAASFDGLLFPAITGVEQHSIKILETAGVKTAPTALTSTECLVRLFKEGQLGRTVHVTAHGVHNREADCSGVLVSSDAAAQNVVEARELADPDGPRVHFAFFNCCELGYRDDEAAADSFHSSFTGALIRRAACREAICNRWSVSQKQALAIAEEFYLLKPRTVYGRALALLAARRRLLDRDPNAEKDLSWLAPIHVWEC